MDPIPYCTCSCFYPHSYQAPQGPQSDFLQSCVTTHTIPAAVLPSQPEEPKTMITPTPNPGFSYWSVLYMFVAILFIIFVLHSKKIRHTSAGDAEKLLKAKPDFVERRNNAASRVSPASKDGGLTTGASKKMGDGKDTGEVKSGGGGTGAHTVAGTAIGTGIGTNPNAGTATDSRLRDATRRTEGTAVKTPPRKPKGPKADYAW